MWLDKNRMIRAIRRGISENPAALIGTDAATLIPCTEQRKSFLKALARAWYYSLPTLYMELDLLIEGYPHTRQCHIIKDTDDPERILVVFYAVEQ